MKKIIVMLDRCIGCKSCEKACAQEHSPAKGLGRLEAHKEKLLPRIKVEFGPASEHSDGRRVRGKPYPVRCHHCTEPQCVIACMSGALVKGDDGIVRHDAEKCVGCWMCIMSCPYGAIRRDLESHVIVKCDMCTDRVTPACVSACRSGAMVIQWEEVDPIKEPSSSAVIEG